MKSEIFSDRTLNAVGSSSLDPNLVNKLRIQISRLGITAGGMLVYSGSQLLTMMILARGYGLPTAGQYALATAVANPVFTLLGMNLRTVSSSGVRVTERAALGRLRTLSLLVSVVLTLVVCSALSVAPSFFALAAAIAATKFIDGLSDLSYGHLQYQGLHNRVAVSQVIRGIGLLGSVSLAAGLGTRLDVAMIGVVAIWSLVLVFIDNRPLQQYYRNGKEWAETSIVWRLLARYYPLGAAVGVLQLNNCIGRIYIGHVHGEAMVGVFSCLYYIVFIPHLLMTAIGQRLTPLLGRYVSDRDVTGFRSTSRKMLLAALFIHASSTAASCIAGEYVLGLLFGDELRAYASHLVWISALCGMSVYVIAIGYPLTACRVYNLQTIAFLSGLAANAVWMLATIQSWPLMGAAGGMALSSVVGGLICALRLHRSIESRFAV